MCSRHRGVVFDPSPIVPDSAPRKWHRQANGTCPRPLDESTIVDTLIVPVVLATTMALVETVISLVGITVGKCGPPVSVPTTVSTITLVGFVVVLHPTRSVGHTGRAQNNTCERALTVLSATLKNAHCMQCALNPFSTITQCSLFVFCRQKQRESDCFLLGSQGGGSAKNAPLLGIHPQ